MDNMTMRQSVETSEIVPFRQKACGGNATFQRDNIIYSAKPIQLQNHFYAQKALEKRSEKVFLFQESCRQKRFCGSYTKNTASANWTLVLGKIKGIGEQTLMAHYWIKSFDSIFFAKLFSYSWELLELDKGVI